MECIVQGQNKFDEYVSTFLGEIGKENVISVTPFTYMEKGEDWTDYGVIVYYAQPDGGVGKRTMGMLRRAKNA